MILFSSPRSRRGAEIFRKVKFIRLRYTEILSKREFGFAKSIIQNISLRLSASAVKIILSGV